MAIIAWRLPADQRHAQPRSMHPRDLVEWPVLAGAVTLFLYSFSYGAITSFVAVYADQVGVSPRALYFSAFCLTIVATRPFIGRYADRAGHARLIVPCLAMIVLGVWTLAAADSRAMFLVSALLFGAGFGSAYPIFIAHLMQHVAAHRRGATFGAVIGAFDTGIGTGSIAVGWISERYGFSRAFGVAGALALLSIPYFLYMEKRQWTTSVSARQA
jgi:MFS family permease